MDTLISDLESSKRSVSRSSIKNKEKSKLSNHGKGWGSSESLIQDIDKIEVLRRQERSSDRESSLFKSSGHNHLRDGQPVRILPLGTSSLEETSTRFRSERRLVSRKELRSVSKEVLEVVYEHLASTCGQILSRELLQTWEHHRKASTVNQYASSFKKWMEYCSSEEKPPLPAKPFMVAGWLAAMALQDNTASPTDARCATINYFSKIADAPSPTASPIVEMTKESIRRKLG